MRYVIVAPTYNGKSAGISVLQELQKWLIRAGKDAIMPNININAPYHVQDDDIVVYPEIISGNPLKAKRVVRYILNDPGKLGGDKVYDSNEILVAYAEVLSRYSNGVYLEIPIIEDFFTDRGCERVVDCFWIGKGRNTGHPATKDCIEITYHWPSKRRELAELLNRTRIFYSYDDRTHLLTEAMLCGCAIKLIRNDELADLIQPPPPNKEEFQRQLDQFIQLTWYPEMDSNREAVTYIESVISNRAPYYVASLSDVPRMTSIVILTHNQIEYTKLCIESVRTLTDVPHETIFVDNASTDGTVDWLKSLVKDNPHYKLIENQENLGFAKGCNQGMKASSGAYVLLLNNDAVVTPGWLNRMIDCAEKKQQIGLVGPMSNCVSGPQLLRDISYNTDTLEDLDKFAHEHGMKHQGKAKTLWRVVGFCMLIKRAVIEKIGGFDSRYGLGNFEDDDFSLRAALAGFESWIAQDCFVHHFGNKTFSGASIDYSTSLLKNWEIFKRKWGIPLDVPYGGAFSIDSSSGFVLAKHYCPLDAEENIDLIRAGEEAFRAGKAEEAQSHFEKALLLNPFDANTYNKMSVVFRYQGKIEDALKSLARALELDRDNRDAIINCSRILHELGKNESAGTILNSYLVRNPWDKEVLNELEAAKNAVQPIEAPCDADPLTKEGEHQLAQGNLDDALILFHKALERDPDAGKAHSNLGAIYWQKGELNRAVEHFRSALHMNPEDPEVLFNVSQALETAGELEVAAILLSAHLMKHPQDEATSKEYARLLRSI